MRRYLPLVLLGLTAAAPLLGCDLLKQKEVDAGADGSVVAVAAPDPNLTATTAATPVATTAAPPLNGGAAPPVTPTVKTDGGAVADSGVKSDAAPAPMPTFPGFDAGQLHNFDAGGLFKVPDGGFKPPWPVPTK